MPKYSCGFLTISFDLEKLQHGRAEYQVMINLDNGDEQGVIESGGYTCPSDWNDEKIARDLVGWAVDKHEHLYYEVEYDLANNAFDNYNVQPLSEIKK